MDSAFNDISVDKIKLIYEFDKSSPLFCRVANYEIARGNYLHALEILSKGLETCPDYPTAHIINSIALAYSGDEHRAKDSIEKCSQYFSEPGTIEYYLNKIDRILAERNSLTDTKRPAFIDNKEAPAEENKFFNIEDRLDDLAKELSKAKIKVTVNDNTPNEEVPPAFSGKKIASETLAKIYISQKNYEEAINVFKELITTNPAKENYYIQQIVELETMM